MACHSPDGAEHDRRDSRENNRVLHEYTHSDSTLGVPREGSGDRSGMQRANVQVCARAKHITAVPASQPWPPDHLTISASGHTHPHRHRTRIAIAVALLCAAGPSSDLHEVAGRERLADIQVILLR